MDRYIIDFYCPEARLAIELDGGGHNFANRESLDQERTRFLASKNILVLRFWNYQINLGTGKFDPADYSFVVKRRGNPPP